MFLNNRREQSMKTGPFKKPTMVDKRLKFCKTTQISVWPTLVD